MSVQGVANGIHTGRGLDSRPVPRSKIVISAVPACARSAAVAVNVLWTKSMGRSAPFHRATAEVDSPEAPIVIAVSTAALTLDGDTDDNTGRSRGTSAGATRNEAGAETPPPGEGFCSVIDKVPATVRSACVSATVSVLSAFNEAARVFPLTIAAVEPRKPAPVIVMFAAGLPVGKPFGNRVWIVGIGFVPAAATTGSKNRFEAPLA